MKLNDIKKEYFILVIFAVLVAIFYGNSLKNGFIYDDFQQVVENEYIHSLRYLPKVVTGCTWEYAFNGCKDRAIYYRPIHSLSYLLTYQISSGAGFFHFVNLFYFFLVVSLVFFLAKALSNNFMFSAASALIFLIHPVNSETVNWIAAVPELTLAIFVLLSTIFYLNYRQTNSLKKFIAAAGFYFLAILSKEPAILLPLIFLFIDWRLFNRKKEDFLHWGEIRNYLLLAGLSFVYFLMRLMVLGNFFSQGKSPYAPFSFGERVFAFFHLFSRYLKKFFFPQPLVFFSFFEKQSRFFNLSFLFSFLAAAGFFAAIFLAFRKNKNILLFAFVWIFVFLLPVLIFVEATGESVFSERYAFVPNIGFALAVAYFFAVFWKKRKNLRPGLLFVFLIFAGISGKIIFSRNWDWVDNETMYAKTLIQNPDATPIRFNYAVLLRNEKKDFEAAKEQFEEILRRKPNWGDIPMIYLHLGDYYLEKGEEDKALDYYHKSAAASDDWKTNFGYNRLGVFYAKKENYLMALTYFCQAVQAGPDLKESQANFNKAISLIELDYKDNPGLLYDKITDNSVFSKSPENKISYENRDCRDNVCAFVFSPKIGEFEIILPFLITAANEKNESVKIENPSFNAEFKKIILGTDIKYEKDTVKFVFPTCDGIYYQAEAKAE